MPRLLHRMGKYLQVMFTTNFILFQIENYYYKNPFEIPEGTHGRLASWIGLWIDVMTKLLYN